MSWVDDFTESAKTSLATTFGATIGQAARNALGDGVGIQVGSAPVVRIVPVAPAQDAIRPAGYYDYSNLALAILALGVVLLIWED